MAEVLFKQIQVELAARVSQHPSVPVTGYGWHTVPTTHPELLQPGAWAALPYIIQPFWLPGLFVYPWPLDLLVS